MPNSVKIYPLEWGGGQEGGGQNKESDKTIGQNCQRLEK